MPKAQPFNIEDGYKDILQNILKKQVQEECMKINILGVCITSFAIYDNTNYKQLSSEEYNELIKKDSIIDLLKQHYETQKAEKIRIYESLRARGDAILYDFKPYINLIKAIDEFSYCGASSEIETMINKQTKGTSYAKAVYRARRQEFNKIKC